MSITGAISGLDRFAVVVAWILHGVISLVRFQPVFFGKAWVRR